MTDGARDDAAARVRTPLLALITAEALERDYQLVAQRRVASGGPPHGKDRVPGRVGVVVVVAVFGILLTIAAVQTSANADADSASRDSLIERIGVRREAVQDLQARDLRPARGQRRRRAAGCSRQATPSTTSRARRPTSAAPPDSPRSSAKASGSSSTTRPPPTPTPSTSGTPTWPCSSTRCGRPARRRSRSTGSGSRPAPPSATPARRSRSTRPASRRRTSSRRSATTTPSRPGWSRRPAARRSRCWPVTTAGATTWTMWTSCGYRLHRSGCGSYGRRRS